MEIKLRRVRVTSTEMDMHLRLQREQWSARQKTFVMDHGTFAKKVNKDDHYRLLQALVGQKEIRRTQLIGPFCNMWAHLSAEEAST